MEASFNSDHLSARNPSRSFSKTGCFFDYYYFLYFHIYELKTSADFIKKSDTKNPIKYTGILYLKCIN